MESVFWQMVIAKYTYKYDNDMDRVYRDNDWECPNHRPLVP